MPLRYDARRFTRSDRIVACAATFSPRPPSPSSVSARRVVYITIFRHRRARSSPGYLAPAIIFSSFCLFFSCVSLLFSVRPPMVSFLEDNARPRTLHFKCGESRTRADRPRIDRESRAYRLTTLKGNNFDGDAGRLRYIAAVGSRRSAFTTRARARAVPASICASCASLQRASLNPKTRQWFARFIFKGITREDILILFSL